MNLTTAQIATLKADILANNNTIPAGQPWSGTYAGVAVKNVINGNNFDQGIAVAGWYNQNVSPNYFIWKSNADKGLVDSQINKANFTPSDAVPASGSTAQITNDQLVYNNRALLAQLKQTNAQWLTQTNGTVPINAQIASLRQNFKDCLLQIPTGTSGANQDAGWGTASVPGAVRVALMRIVTIFEKLFCTAGSGAGNVGTDARGANTNPDISGVGSDSLPVEGQVGMQDVLNAVNN